MKTTLFAEIYRLGLLSGFFDIYTVAVWVDSIIEEQDITEYYLIEASLSASKGINEIATKLKVDLNEEEKRQALYILLGLFYQEIKHERSKCREIARILYNLTLHIEGEMVGERKFFLMNMLDDYYDMAERKIYGDFSELDTKLEDLLQEYGEYASYFRIS